MKEEEFNDILNKYCDGTATDAEFQKLESAIKEDEALRRQYLSFMNLDSALRSEAEKADLAEPVQVKQLNPIFKVLVGLAAAIVILLGLNLTYLFKNNRAIDGDYAEGEPVQKGVAIVTKSINISGANQILENGTAVEQGELRFASGIIQLEMFSGVTLLIEGPARLNIHDVMNLSCYEGQIRARVSEQAQGFSIKTGDAKLVDLGTEFGITVNNEGKTDVFVYEGEVDFYPESSEKRNLKTNEALTWHNKKITEAAIDNSLMTFQSVEDIHSKFTNKKLDSWKEYAESIRNRKDVVLFYGFDDYSKWSRTILNEVENAASSTNGAIIGCKWSEGRWPGKGALEFKNTSDRIKLNIPGEYKNMTFSCWVRIEGFDRWLSSLLLTDDYKEGALHWQLSDSGEIILGARRNGNTFSKRVIFPEDLGRWLHIATVYNAEKREVVHFLNGKPVIRDQIEHLQTIHLGNSEIGNWYCRPGTNHAVRSLNGRLDEFIIFSSALSDEEVKNMYLRGIPQ